MLTDSSSSDEDSDIVSLRSDDLSETFSDIEDEISASLSTSANIPKTRQEDLAINDFVVVSYNGAKYPGKIVSITKEGPKIECMERKLKCWRWPEKSDVSIYDWEDVSGKIQPPKMISKRNQYAVPELDTFV